MQAGARFGRYQLGRQLGSDGGGEIWAAFDTLTSRDVTLRALPADWAADDAAIAKFEHDAHTAERIHHPLISPIHDAGQIGDRLFVATALTEGAVLRTVLSSSGPLEPERAVDVVEQLSTAVDAVRAAGLPAPQVRSSEVVVHESGPVSLTDVGIGRQSGDATGVYGLAALLRECLTGEQVGNRSGQSAQLSPALVDVIDRGTAADPGRRYRSTGEFAAAARAALAPAPPVAAASSVSAPINRRRGLVIAGVALAAVVLVGTAAAATVDWGESSDDGTTTSTTQVTSAVLPAPPATAAPSTTVAEETPAPAPPQPPAPTQAPNTPPPVATEQPSAPGVLPCYAGYEHTPPPDGPCLPPGSPVGPAQPQAPQQPVQPPSPPGVLPCYPGYQHTPPPDGPCFAPG